MTLVVGAARTIVEGSATILAGIVTAAYLRTLATPEKVAVIFRGEGPQGLLRATLVGMALPVCAIGVLPVLRELRRLGLPTSKLLTFGLAAPLLNPITLVYGLSVLSFSNFLLVVAATVVVSITVCDVSSRFAVDPQPTSEPLPRGLTGGTRLWNLFIASGRIATGWTATDFAIVVLVSAVTASFLPPGLFEELCSRSNRLGPIEATALALPQYVSPATGVMQLSSLSKVNLSIPTGLAVYVFGVGFSAGTIVWLVKWFGPRRVTALGLATILVAVAASYGSQSLLPVPVAQEEETHGLDALTRPHHASFGSLGHAVSYGLSYTDPMMRGGAVLLALLLTSGVVFRLLKVRFRDDDPEKVATDTDSRMSRAVPASQIGAVAVCGMALFVCLVSYIYFPGPKESMEEMRTLQADAIVAIRTGKTGWALEQLAAWDQTAAKLPVGAAIRFSFPTAEQRSATRALRTQLLWMQDRVRDGDMIAATQQSGDLMNLQLAAQRAYLRERP
ncbi:permease [Stratiformator vulcanicus]|uniref:permease n=1 Tax=Stratiformator vulcanicus TaxID=2527980 RepID=UPI0028775B03|nr:permease [Stratiformator vulcanicus]